MVAPPRRQGIFKSLLSRIGIETKDTGTLADPPPWLELLFAGDIFPSLAGVTVSLLTAMTCAPVRCAVQAIAESVAQLPLEIFEQGENGDKSANTNHPAYTLLHSAPNDWTPAATFIEQVTRDAPLERHGGFAFINRVDGKPIELIRLDPLFSQVTPRYINGEPQYFVVEGGKERVIPRENILHIPSPSLHGILHDAREAIGLALVMEQYASRLFGRGARPAGILKFKGKLDAASSACMKASWQAAHGGNNSGGTAIIEEDAGGVWVAPRGRQYKCDIQPLYTPDVWANYCLRDGPKARRLIKGRAVSITTPLRRRAKELWSVLTDARCDCQ